MQERQKLNIDPFLSEKFFTIQDQKDFQITVPFALPESPETLASFLASEKGCQFKKEMEALFDALAAWAKNNDIDFRKASKKFKKYYINYSGQDEGLNKIVFSLYKEGITALAGIVDLLHSKKITLSYSKLVIQNLALGIVCAPGTATNFQNAYLNLLAQTNLPAKWLHFRKELLHELILSWLKKYDYEEEIEVHYPNAVFNHYGDVFSVTPVEDQFVTLCDPAILEGLLEAIPKKFADQLTVKTLIEYLIQELDMGQLPENIKQSSLFNETVTEFLQKLDIFGIEGTKKFLYADDVLYTADYQTYSLSWKVKYILFLSLLHRLMVTEWLKAADDIEVQLEKATVHFFKDRSLKFAFVYQEGLKPYQAFLPFCVETFCDGEQKAQETLMNFIIKLSKKEKFEILKAIAKYLNSQEFHSLDEGEQSALLDRFNHVINSIYIGSWEELVNILPPHAAKKFLADKGVIKFSTFSQFMSILKLTEPEDYEKLFDEKHYTNKNDFIMYLFGQGHLVALLQKLPIENFQPFFSCLPASILESFPLGHFTSLKNEIDEQKYTALLKSLPAQFFKARLTSRYELKAILQHIPDTDYEYFLNRLGEEKLTECVSSFEELEIFFDLKGVSDFLLALPATFFLKILKDNIQVGADVLQLQNICKNIQEKERFYFLMKLDAVSKLKNEFTTYWYYLWMFDLLQKDWLLFIAKTDPLFERITDSKKLAFFFGEIKEKEYRRALFSLVLRAFNSAVLGRIILTQDDLLLVMLNLPEQYHVLFLRMYLQGLSAEKLQEIRLNWDNAFIKNPNYWLSINEVIQEIERKNKTTIASLSIFAEKKNEEKVIEFPSLAPHPLIKGIVE